MTPLRTRLAAAAVGAGLVLAAPAAAWAGPRRPASTTPTTAASSPSDSTRPGLEALRVKCLAAIDVRLPALAAAKADVTANQHLTADTATAAGDKLSDIAGKLADAIAKAEAAGRDVTEAKADLDAMNAQMASAAAAAGSVPGAVLGLTPADWNANHDVLSPVRQQLR